MFFKSSLCRTLLCAACDGWTKDPGHTHHPIAILNRLCSWASRVLPCAPRRIKLAKTPDTCPQQNTEAILAQLAQMPDPYVLHLAILRCMKGQSTPAQSKQQFRI
jgi:hypothetical protein